MFQRAPIVALCFLFLVLFGGCSPVRRHVRALKSPDVEVRRTAAWELSVLGGECRGFSDELLDAFLDSDPVVRGNVVATLGKLPASTEGVVTVIRLALNDPDTRVRRAAASALGCMNPVPTVVLPQLACVLGDEDSVLSSFASTLFTDLGPIGIPALRNALTSDVSTTRRNAVVTLGRMGREARYLVPELRRLLDDIDEEVRHAASESIDMIE